MSVRHVVAEIFLWAGVALTLASCVGVASLTSVFERLHFVTPAAVTGSVAIAVAVVIDESFNARGIKALLVAGTLVVLNPILTHATARIARVTRSADSGAARGEKR